MHLYSKDEGVITNTPFSQHMKSNDAIADTLYAQHADAIFTYLRQHTYTREDAEDLLVDIFTAAIEECKLAHFSEQAQISWLWRVTRNKVIDFHRRARVRQSLALEQVKDITDEKRSANPEHAALHLDTVAHVKQLLQNLTPLQREILQLRFGANLHCAEIAEVLDKSESAVRTMLSRALNQLRALNIQA